MTVTSVVLYTFTQAVDYLDWISEQHQILLFTEIVVFFVVVFLASFDLIKFKLC